jgi:hypothetical protein
MPGPNEQHQYHAEAHALSGELMRPLNQKIVPQTSVKLPEKGGYLAERAEPYRLENIISYGAAHTHVAGNLDVKEGHGFSTLVTSVVEKLNVLNVVTCDRVVGQMITEHPLDGHVPIVSFLGTQFENLRIAGHEVKVDLDLCLFGEKPEDDAPYTRSTGFTDKVSDQHARLRGGEFAHPTLLSELLGRYNRLPESFENASGDEETVECSLVNKAEGTYPGRSCGHVIHVPHFGTIYLATVRLKQSDYLPGTRIPRKTLIELTMIDIVMGCAATGKVKAAALIVNGGGGGGKPVAPPPGP